MKIDLFYIEGEHDHIPGIVRDLVATDDAAKKVANELLESGAHVYRQNMSVEISEAYSHLEMEAALCVWEWLNEITVVPKRGKADKAWLEYREGVGSAELRHESITIGKFVLQVYELLPEWYRSSGAYDWEIVPAIVSTLKPRETSRDPIMAKREILSDKSAKEEFFRSCDWLMKRSYGITVEDSGQEKEEFLTTWYSFDDDPETVVDRYAEKYDLTRIR
ncbi:hypothetical protein [Mesorhizobium sp. B2-4-1]|uniref:hypothetical protein n=1 Tax=Mesorhizobium sp. B2-4-1 TaxID=2589948 RepID=UPI00112BFF34|nr:hypothetical protein [Mesorhizobium sp. B2-4-1]TPL66570.1 hypothetical protein FJ949_09385 [Mesorhizobium sp. B2-4-1]